MLHGSNIPQVVMPTGSATVVKKNATVKDTVKLINEISTAHAHEVKELALYLKGNTIKQTCENIWNHVRKFTYREDKEGVEQLRTPARSFHEGVMDCDCATLYISAILKNLSIPHVYRVVAWEEKEKWAHIYPVAINGEKEYVIDFIPEVPYFNYELKNVDKMNIEVLNGYAVAENQNASFTLAGYTEVETDGIVLSGSDIAKLNTQDVYENISSVRAGLANQMDSNINPLGCAQKQELDIIDKVIISFNFENKTNEAIEIASEQSAFKEYYKACSAQLEKNDELKNLSNIRMVKTNDQLGGVLIDKLKNTATKVVNTVKNVGSNIKEAGAAIKNGEGIRVALDNVREGVNSLNPITIAARTAFMTLVRKDFANLGRSLYVGSLSSAQAESQYKFTPNEHAKAKSLYDKVWAKMQNMGQAKANFDMDIKTGAKAAGILNGLNGVAVDPVSAVAMAASNPALGENVKSAGSIIDPIMEMLKSIFAIFKSKEKLAIENSLPLPGSPEFKNLDTNNDGKLSPEEQQQYLKLKSMENEKAPSDAAAPNNTDGWLKRTWSDPKKKWWLIGGSLGLVLIIVLVMWLTMRKPKRSKPMNGRRKYAIQVRPIRRKVRQPKQLAMRLAGATPTMLNGRKKVAKKRKVVTKKRR